MGGEESRGVTGAGSLGGERVRCNGGFGGVEISHKLDIYRSEVTLTQKFKIRRAI